MHCRVKQEKTMARGYKTEEIDARDKEKEVQTENFREHYPTKKIREFRETWFLLIFVSVH